MGVMSVRLAGLGSLPTWQGLRKQHTRHLCNMAHMPPRGLHVTHCFSLDEVQYSIERQPKAPSQRNLEIYRRYASGERTVGLAAEYGLSWQRIYQIIKQVDEYVQEGRPDSKDA
jgi:hypothetical protein